MYSKYNPLYTHYIIQLKGYLKIFPEDRYSTSTSRKKVMAPRSIGCQEIGAIVMAKLTAVTSKAECKRRYGSMWKEAKVKGIIREVINSPKGSGKQASVCVDWLFEGATKQVTVKICNVELCDSNAGPPTSNSHSQHRNDEYIGPQDQPVTQSQQSQGRTAGPSRSAIDLSDAVGTHGLKWAETAIDEPLNGAVEIKKWSVSLFPGGQTRRKRWIKWHVTVRLLHIDVSYVTFREDGPYDEQEFRIYGQARDGWVRND